MKQLRKDADNWSGHCFVTLEVERACDHLACLWTMPPAPHCPHHRHNQHWSAFSYTKSMLALDHKFEISVYLGLSVQCQELRSHGPITEQLIGWQWVVNWLLMSHSLVVNVPLRASNSSSPASWGSCGLIQNGGAQTCKKYQHFGGVLVNWNSQNLLRTNATGDTGGKLKWIREFENRDAQKGGLGARDTHKKHDPAA